MRPSRAVAVGCILAAIITAGACGSRSRDGELSPAAGASSASATTRACTSGSGFELSLASDRGGQTTPVRAAQWLAGHGGVPGIPDKGWREVSRNGHNALVISGSVTLYVIQGADLTWQVASGERCASQHG